MMSDDEISDNLYRLYLFEYENENVTVLTQNKIQKPHDLYEFWGFFLFKTTLLY